MRIIVTGGAGFIGSNLSRRFIEEGHEVTVVDDLSNGEVSFVPPKADKYFCDFAGDTVLKMVRDQKFDVVMHLAALPRVSYSVEHPYETDTNNVNKVVKLMEACRGNVRRFVNTSSSSVYGGAEMLPTTEDVIHSPKSPYALQKSISERYCSLFSDLYDMDTVSVRPFNVFGPNQKGDSPYSCAVSSWLYAVKHGRPLRSDGTGEQSRDITYVDNVVDVFYRCATSAREFRGDAFNAGTGFKVTNNEVLDWFRREFPHVKVVSAPWRPGDVMHTQASMDKSKEILGWRPLVDFWRGLELTREWALNSPEF